MHTRLECVCASCVSVRIHEMLNFSYFTTHRCIGNGVTSELVTIHQRLVWIDNVIAGLCWFWTAICSAHPMNYSNRPRHLAVSLLFVHTGWNQCTASYLTTPTRKDEMNDICVCNVKYIVAFDNFFFSFILLVVHLVILVAVVFLWGKCVWCEDSGKEFENIWRHSNCGNRQYFLALHYI